MNKIRGLTRNQLYLTVEVICAIMYVVVTTQIHHSLLQVILALVTMVVCLIGLKIREHYLKKKIHHFFGKNDYKKVWVYGSKIRVIALLLSACLIVLAAGLVVLGHYLGLLLVGGVYCLYLEIIDEAFYVTKKVIVYDSRILELEKIERYRIVNTALKTGIKYWIMGTAYYLGFKNSYIKDRFLHIFRGRFQTVVEGRVYS